MIICENCGKEIEKGRFCNRSCVCTWQWKQKDIRDKMINNISVSCKKSYIEGRIPNTKKARDIAFEKFEKEGHPFKREDVRNKIRLITNTKAHLEKLRDREGEKNPNWIGDDGNKRSRDDYYHNRAWKLFGKAHCEECGKSLEDELKDQGKRFHMHCMSNPKDYSIIKSNNWMTLCNRCHQQIEKNIRRLSNG